MAKSCFATQTATNVTHAKKSGWSVNEVDPKKVRRHPVYQQFRISSKKQVTAAHTCVVLGCLTGIKRNEFVRQLNV